jgi:hypothetical protein
LIADQDIVHRKMPFLVVSHVRHAIDNRQPLIRLPCMIKMRFEPNPCLEGYLMKAHLYDNLVLGLN